MRFQHARRGAMIAALTIGGGALAQPAPTSVATDDAQGGWVQLFNGKDLSGWVNPGKPGTWSVADGEIRIIDTKDHCWLRTERMYRDFELQLDFKVPPNGNSGVGVRGSALGDPAFSGMEIQILDSVGKTPDVGQCGAVYDAVAPSSIPEKPAGEWNHYLIRLVGDTIDVTLNGVKVVSGEKLDDRGYIWDKTRLWPLKNRLTTGYVALQNHGDAAAFRNIKIKDLSTDPDPGGWTSIVTGDLSGWTKRGGGTWAIEKDHPADLGALVGKDGPGHFFTDATYDNLELRASVKVSEKGNSGIYFRTVPRPEDPNTWPLGYEAQVDNHDPKNFTGVIYDRAWPKDQKGPVSRDGAWFDYRVRAVGGHIQTWINGVPMVDAELSNFSTGHIALQTHNPGNVIMYKDLRVLVLDEHGQPIKK